MYSSARKPRKNGTKRGAETKTKQKNLLLDYFKTDKICFRSRGHSLIRF